MSHRGSNFESFHDLDPLAEDYPQTEGVRRLLLEFFDELPFRNVNTAQMSTFFCLVAGCFFLVGKRKQHKKLLS